MTQHAAYWPQAPVVGAEELRAGALHALGPFGDPVAREALERATITIDSAVSRWMSSAGEMFAHGVHLGLDAHTLARATFSPAAQDALYAAFAGAFAKVPFQSLAELVLCWNGALPDDSGGYRGHVHRDDTTRFREALVCFLAAANDPDAGSLVREVHVTVSETRVEFHVPDDRSPDASRRGAVETAARTLLGGTASIAWHVGR